MLEEFYDKMPYSLMKDSKRKLLLREFIHLTDWHRTHCEAYRHITDGFGYDPTDIKKIEDIPFLPVRLFKELELKSIPDEDVYKVVTSSGTTGQSVSRIFLDKENAKSQQKVMIKILSDYLGKTRLPVLIIDAPSIVKNRQRFSARTAAILGLQVLSTKMTFALKEDMTLDHAVFHEFMAKNQGKKILIFGFTFMVWQHFYQEVSSWQEKPDLSHAWLMTGGGWKKMDAMKLSREAFQKKITQATGITHFLDHYGMVEQTGCIYAECEYGHLHASIYSEVIARHYEDFTPCAIGEKGILQVLSVLPRAYPGHSLLTEDEGIILGEDDCPCGRKGKYIQITGRLKSAELRGCSDTYAAKYVQ